MNLLDWVLILVVVLYAVSGYWQGFITGAFATVGLLVGGLIGVWARAHGSGQREPVDPGLARRGLHRDHLRLARAGAVPDRRGARLRVQDHLAAGARARRRRWGRAERGRRPAGRLGARGRALGLRAARHHPLVRDSKVLAEVNRVLPAEAELEAVGVQRRRRHDVLPALPRAVRAGADRARCRPARAGCSPTPTSSAPPATSSASAAPTAATRASRGRASSTPPTG